MARSTRMGGWSSNGWLPKGRKYMTRAQQQLWAENEALHKLCVRADRNRRQRQVRRAH
jgi:hypothetical protein